MALSEKSRQKLIKKGGSAGMSLLRFVLLAGISFVILYPLVTKILVSFMPVSDVYDMSVHYIPKTFTLSNYQKAWDFLNIPALAFNSFFYPLVVSLIQTPLSWPMVSPGSTSGSRAFSSSWSCWAWWCRRISSCCPCT